MDKLEEMHYFASPFYVVKKVEFLETMRAVSDRYVQDAMRARDYRELLMTASYMHEDEVAEFAQYVSQTAWNILASQGHKMDQMVTFFTEMWTQEHRHLSAMETHVHGHGAQINCFYFLDAPIGSSKLVIHDPRPGKVMVNLQETNPNEITLATQQIVFTPEPGSMIFTNSWLPHSLTKNQSQEPVRFVHMNLAVAPAPEQSVEVV